jgi:hypothetical protein
VRGRLISALSHLLLVLVVNHGIKKGNFLITTLVRERDMALYRFSGSAFCFFLVTISCLVIPGATFAGYAVTDKDGKVLSEEPGNTLVLGPTNQTIILNDRGNRKVFELTWDAAAGAMVIKGDRVHLKIHDSGKIEKWTELDREKGDSSPLLIQPIIPVPPAPRR